MKTKKTALFLLLAIGLFAYTCHATDPYWDGYDDAQNGYWQRSEDREYLAGYEHGENGDEAYKTPEEVNFSPITNKPKPSTKRKPRQARLILKANRLGGYITQGKINGKTVEFVIDTGASYVSLSKATADKLRLKYSKTKPMKMQTASGVDRAYFTTIKEISIGEIVLYDVPAAISTHNFPKHVLLGMSFLGQLDITQNNHEMILTKK